MPKKIDHEAVRHFEQQAASPNLKPGRLLKGRWIDPYDYERWQKQREERKKRCCKVDPFRI